MRLFIFLSIFWANSLFAQKSFYTLDTIIAMPYKSLPHPGKLAYNLKAVLIHDKIMYISKSDNPGTPQYIYSLDLKSWKHDSLIIKKASRYGFDKESWLDICADELGDIYLLTDLNIFRFHPDSGAYTVSGIYQFEGPYRYIGSLSNSTLFLGEIFNHEAVEGNKCKLSVLRTSSNQSRSYYPQVANIGISHYGMYPRSTSRAGKIYYIDLNDYQVYEVDSQLGQVKTIISHNKENWAYLSPAARKAINSLGSDGYEILNYIRENKVRISQVNRLLFINDSTLLLGYNLFNRKGESLKYYDTWQFDQSEGKWKLKFSGISDNTKAKPRYTSDNYPLEFVSQMLLASDEQIIRINYSSGLSAVGLTQKEYEAKVDQYYEKNSARLVFTVFKHSFIQ